MNDVEFHSLSLGVNPQAERAKDAKAPSQNGTHEEPASSGLGTLSAEL